MDKTAEEGSLRRELGDQIRRARLARGWTIREAAERMGLSYQMLGQIEKHGQNTNIKKLEGIVAGLDAHVELRLDLPPAPPPTVDGVPEHLRAIAERFLGVIAVMNEEELDVFLHQLSLWERRRDLAKRV